MISKKKKKKKGLRQNSEWVFGRNPNFKRFFRVISKKILRQDDMGSWHFSSNFASSNVWRGALFVWGGAIFHFLQKIGLKSTKNMRFCILHKPMGGARAPPAPPLATLLGVLYLKFSSSLDNYLSHDQIIFSTDFWRWHGVMAYLFRGDIWPWLPFWVSWIV